MPTDMTMTLLLPVMMQEGGLSLGSGPGTDCN
jgi:hypothetical protein